MTTTASKVENEARGTARLLQSLAEGVEAREPAELAMKWQAIERRVFACLRALEAELEGRAPDLAEIERLRNLAWEVGVSIELHSVHSRALQLLSERLAARVAKARSPRAPVAAASAP